MPLVHLQRLCMEIWMAAIQTEAFRYLNLIQASFLSIAPELFRLRIHAARAKLESWNPLYLCKLSIEG